MIHITGYIPCRLDRPPNKKGGGVVIYIRKDINWNNLESSSSIINENIEILTIILNRKCQKKLYLSVIYIPPKSRIENALSIISEVASEIGIHNAEWILDGE